MVRFLIVLTLEEASALNKMAEKDLRTTKDQVRFLIQQELLRCGFLKQEPSPVTSLLVQKAWDHSAITSGN